MAIDKGTVPVLAIVGSVILFSLIVVLVPRETLPEASIGAPYQSVKTSELTMAAPRCKVVGDPSSSHTFEELKKLEDNCPSDPVKVVKTQQVTVKGTYYKSDGTAVKAQNECTSCATTGNEECVKYLKSDKNKEAAEAYCKTRCRSSDTATYDCGGILNNKYSGEWIIVQTYTTLPKDDGTTEDLPDVECEQIKDKYGNIDGKFTCKGTFECLCIRYPKPEQPGDSGGEVPGDTLNLG